MKHFKLVEHTEECIHKKENYFKSLKDPKVNQLFNLYYPCQTDTLVFLIKGEFMIIEYVECHNKIHHLDFKERIIKELLKSVSNKYKKRLYYNVNRSICDYDNFKNEAKRNAIYNERHSEINYFYHNNANKEYYFTTDYDFASYVINQEYLDEDYKKTLDYIKKEEINIDMEFLEKLRLLNSAPYFSEAFIVRSINEITNNIKKEIR